MATFAQCPRCNCNDEGTDIFKCSICGIIFCSVCGGYGSGYDNRTALCTNSKCHEAEAYGMPEVRSAQSLGRVES